MKKLAYLGCALEAADDRITLIHKVFVTIEECFWQPRNYHPGLVFEVGIGSNEASCRECGTNAQEVMTIAANALEDVAVALTLPTCCRR